MKSWVALVTVPGNTTTYIPTAPSVVVSDQAHVAQSTRVPAEAGQLMIRFLVGRLRGFLWYVLSMVAVLSPILILVAFVVLAANPKR